MIFPIGDDQVKGGYFPIFSYAFIVLNVLAFFFQLSSPDLFVCQYGSIPNEILANQDYHTLFTSMFMHGSWMHLIGNMLFLWVFADNIEAVVGNLNFVVFYILGGLAASFAHIYVGVYFGGEVSDVACCAICLGDSYNDCVAQTVACAGSIPSVGASGAISAVMGAYLLMFPTSRIKMWALFTSFRIPAILFLGFWIFNQWMSGRAALEGSSGGVAWWAHIGGFAFGVFAGLFGRSSVREHHEKSNAPIGGSATNGDYV